MPHQPIIKIAFSFFQFGFIAIIISCSTKQQYFTGSLTYNYKYTSDSLNTDSISRVRPGKGEFRYDENSYQSRFMGADTFTYYYSGTLNKCLSEAGASKKYECEDYSIATDSVNSWKVYDTDEKVLGYDCHILEMQKTNSWVKYHVAKYLIIAPSTYQKHKSYNWDFYGEKAGGGLILKLEHQFKSFTMKGEATIVNLQPANTFKALEIDTALFTKTCK